MDLLGRLIVPHDDVDTCRVDSPLSKHPRSPTVPPSSPLSSAPSSVYGFETPVSA